MTLQFPIWHADYQRLKPHIEAALEHCGGTHWIEDILRGLLEGRYQIWPSRDAVIVTEVVQYPRKRALNLFLAGGNLDELDALLPHVEAWAARAGCESVELTARPGWVRIRRRGMADRGYQGRWYVMAKEVIHG